MNVVRAAQAKDRERILGICRDVWDGHDYVPRVLDDWLANKEMGTLLVLEADGVVRGLCRVTRFSSTEGWLEGLRVETGYRGRGYARDLTEASLDAARKMGFMSVRCSTYRENVESRHILESFGFATAARFQLFERVLRPAEISEEGLCPGDQVFRVQGSCFFRLARGLLPMGWQFPSWDAVRREVGHRLRVVCLDSGLLVVDTCSPGTTLNVCLWDGRSDAERVNAWLDGFGASAGYSHVLAMVPQGHWLQLVLPDLGWTAWNEPGAPDVFVSRRSLE